MQRNYKLFNMDGKRYYSFKAPKQDVRFFVLESTYMVPEQVKWIEKELANSQGGLEDRLLPSPPLFLGEPARLGHRVA